MKVEKIKKTGKKYKIIFDNNSKLITYDDVIINNGLLYHPNIDSNILNKINKDTNYYDIYYKTVNYITRKLRSEKEIIEFIDKENVNDKDKKDVLKKLKEIGLINDLIFTKAYISDHINLTSDGPYKIKKSLLEHNISEEVIDDELNKLDKDLIDTKLNKLIRKKIKNTKYTGFYLKQKLINDFVNLGFDKQNIIDLYENIDIDSSELLKKEYDKLYKKLSIKYSGKDLENKIKTKLYQKGFTIEEINNIDF